MSKLITFFLFLFTGATMLSAIMEGGGGVLAIELETTIDADATTVEVASTTDFLSSDYIIIGNEKIRYTNTTATDFTGCTRGYDDTTATSHVAGTMVYSPEGSAVEGALGFNVAATTDSMGLWSVITIPFFFLTRTLPNIIQMNFSFLSGDLAIIGWFFFAAGTGLVITIALALAGARRV